MFKKIKTVYGFKKESYPFCTTWLSKTLSVYKNAYTYVHKTTYLHIHTPSNLINQTKPRDIHSAFIWEDRKEKSKYLLLRQTRTRDFFLSFFLTLSLTVLSWAMPALFFFFLVCVTYFFDSCLFYSLVNHLKPGTSGWTGSNCGSNIYTYICGLELLSAVVRDRW